MQPEEVESILAHELAHIQRNDYILNLLQSLMEIALFFNPATWWISSLIRNEREHCCDEMAIAHTGNQLVYIKTLAKLQEMIKMDQNDRKIEVMELQEKLQDVELESQLLQKQKQSGLEVLQLQMQLEMEKLQGKDKEE